MKKLWLLVLTAVFVVAGCSSNKSTPPPPATPVSVSVSPTSATVDIGGTQQFTATVTGTPNTAVTWAVSGTGCTGGQCGTITATGLYSAPDAPPTTVTVTATSVADTSKSATASVSVLTRTNGGISGQYAFYFGGFETQDNSPAAIAGSFTANGTGGITGGAVDLNRPTGLDGQNIAVTGGTYSFGADNRGRISLNVATVPTPSTLTFRFAMDAPSVPAPNTSKKGRLLAFTPPGTAGGLLGVGVIKQQDNTAFSRAAFNGGFAFGVSGNQGGIDPGTGVYNRWAGVGQLALDATTGAVTSGSVDTNTAGVISSTTTVVAPASPTIDANGRGTQLLTVGGPPAVNITFYVVSANEAFVVDTDARTVNSSVASGSMLKQAGAPYATGSFNAAAVFNLSAQGTTAATRATIGQLVGDGVGGAPGTQDQNDGGTITGPTALTWTYSIPTGLVGRGTMGPGGAGYVFYLSAANRAFLLDVATAQVGFGSMEPQTGGPFTTASLSGSYFVGTNSMATCDCAGVSGYATMGGASGAFTGNRDRRVAGSDPFPREAWSGTYTIPVPPGATTGRGTLTISLPVPPGPENAVIYVISPTKFLMIIVAPGTVTAPVVTVFERWN